MKIWNAFHCSSWPSLRVIDPEGNLVAMRNGEVDFETLDTFFKSKLEYYRKQKLLNEKPIKFDLEASKAAATELRYPGKILADEAGKRLFIADSNHERIVVTDLNGKPIAPVIIGGQQLGRADGSFGTARFNHPQGMALRGDTLYVADTENHLIRKIDLKAQKVKTIAGTGEQSPFPWPGLDPAATKDQVPEKYVGAPLKTALTSPWDLWIARDNLYIAMAGGHQIWKMPLDESEIGPYAGNGREDIVDGPLLPKVPYDQDFCSFAQPSGLTSDGKSLFVADSEGSSIRAVPLAGNGSVSTVLGNAELPAARLFTFGDVDGGPGKGKLQHCIGVAYHDGKIYVADTYNHKIKELDLKTRELKTLAGTGKPGHDDSPQKAGQPAASFFEPAGISYAAGKLFVADTNNHLIRVIDLKDQNRVSTLAISGLPPPSFGGNLGPEDIFGK